MSGTLPRAFTRSSDKAYHRPAVVGCPWRFVQRDPRTSKKIHDTSSSFDWDRLGWRHSRGYAGRV